MTQPRRTNGKQGLCHTAARQSAEDRRQELLSRRWQQQKWEQRPFTAGTVGRMYGAARQLRWPVKPLGGITKPTMWRAGIVALYFLPASLSDLVALKWSDIGDGKVKLSGKSHPLHPTLARHLHLIRNASGNELVFGLEPQHKRGIWKGLAALARMVGFDPTKTLLLMQTLAAAEWRGATKEARETLKRDGGEARGKQYRERRDELALKLWKYPPEFDH